MVKATQIQPESKFNSIGLGISVLIFLSTFSYWFVGENSQGSLINVFMNRNINRSFGGSNPYDYNKLQWGVFFTHLVVTAIGLLIYYNSNIAKWIGRKISFLYPVASFFYKNNPLAKGLILTFKIIIGFLLVYTLYNILIEITKGDVLPRSEFRTFVCLFFIATAGWFIKYPKPDEVPEFVGNIDNRDKTMWLRLCDNQIAYMQDKTDKNEWLLIKSKREVDLSYTEAYIFYEKTFSHNFKDLIISEDIIGKLVYSLRIIPNLNAFPGRLSTDALQILYNKFRTKEDIENLIITSIDKNSLLNEARNEIYGSLNKYFDTDANILANQSNQMNTDYQSILRDVTSFASLNGEVSRHLKNKVVELFHTEDMFSVIFEITKPGFDMDEILKEIRDSRKEVSTIATKGNIDVQKQLVETATKIAMTPGVSNTRIDNLLNFASKLNKSFSQNNQEKLLETEHNSQQLVNPIKAASANVINAIFEIMDKDPTPDLLTEAVSKSTPYISENQIPIDDFVKRFFQKMSDEKVERTQEAYRQLAEDTFTEFIDKR